MSRLEPAAMRYAEEAKTRIRVIGTQAIAHFLKEIPPRQLETWLLSLPPIPGFRRKGKQAADEQRKRFVHRIVNAPKQSDRDWRLFTHLWTTWSDSHMASESLRLLLDHVQHDPERADESGIVSTLVTELTELANTGEISREVLEQFIRFSPFEDISTLLNAAQIAPVQRDISLAKYVNALPEQLAKIESSLKEIADRQITHEDAPGEPPIDAQLSEVTQLLTSLSTQVSTLATQHDDVRRALESSVRRGAEADSRLRLLEESLSSQNATQDRLSSVGKVDELVDDVLSTLEKIDSIDKRLSLLESRPAESPTEVSHLTVVGTQEDLHGTDALVNVRDISGLLNAIQKTMRDLGLLTDDAQTLAGEIVCAVLAGQLISLGGSAASEVLAGLATLLLNKFSTASIPIGLFDDRDLAKWLDNASKDDYEVLALIGVNRSAFEAYGTPIRNVIVHHQLTRVPGRQIFCCTVLEAPGALPLVPSFCELGPVIELDSLRWRTNLEEINIQSVRLDAAAIISDLEPRKVEAGAETWSDILEALKIESSTVLTSSLQNAATISANIGLGDTWAVSFLASWILPYAVAVGLSCDDIKKRLSTSPFAELLGHRRVERILAGHAQRNRQ